MARIIEHDDPEYEAAYARGWGAGMSITSRQAACLARSEKKSPRPTKQEQQEPQQEADPPQPCVGLQEDHLLANTESGED